MNRFIISPLAQQDLDEIWDYSFKSWGIDQADKYIFDIAKVIHYLASENRLGTQVLLGGKTYRKFPVNSHIIFYKIVQEDLIDIIRILNSRMDVENWLD